MPVKGAGPTEPRVIDRWEGGVGWIAYPDEGMRRASHALVAESGSESGADDVWVIDPVDADGVDGLLAEYGEVAGVAVGLDRHTRDAATLARRHGVAVHVPDWMSGVADDLDAPVERFGRRLGDTQFRAFTVRDSMLPPWQEAGFYREADGTLVVPEAVGTAPLWLAGGESLGVHPMLRLIPPKRPLGRARPERILVGHGEGVFEDATEALRGALSNSVGNAPSLYARALRTALS